MKLPVIQPDSVNPADTAPPVFSKVGIVGLGLIGGSIALAARRAWPRGLVIGVDHNDVLEKAMVLHAIDVAAADLVIMAEADLVILAAPARRNIELLSQIADAIPEAAVVTDTSSTKREIVAAARALPSRLTFIGGHPLGGAARGGIDHATADLFKGRPWLFTPEPGTSPAALASLQRFVSALGAGPKTMEAEAHDRTLAFLSHLPQLTASALMSVIGDAVGADALALAGRGLADTTRLASSPAGLWRDVCATNADNIAAALDLLIERLQELRVDLADGDRLAEVFDAANEWRESIKK
ncbi:MAG: prephenate dehydrogenase/arogenate dehydrogenase family protein [Acidobacteria bacterium]|nr:prephenate dehydrogenase/arogenate dehydrogenase family protein [Acidobacteriota bacterium]